MNKMDKCVNCGDDISQFDQIWWHTISKGKICHCGCENPEPVKMLDGVRILDITKIPDERGIFAEIFRKDWNELTEGEGIVQANLSVIYPGIIKAWHRHKRKQVDYLVVLKGAIKLCVYDEDKKQLGELVLNTERLQIARVPGHYWHGMKVISSEPVVLVYFVNNFYDHNKPDEERKAWNDPSIIDSRTRKPFDWNKLPHK